jgi:hypothetical protein
MLLWRSLPLSLLHYDDYPIRGEVLSRSTLLGLGVHLNAGGAFSP